MTGMSKIRFSSSSHLYGCCILIASLLIGCASTPHKREYIENLQGGDLEKAEEIIRERDKRKHDALLRELNLASIAQIKNDFADSNRRLEKSKNIAEELSAVSVTETVAAVTVNQRVSQFSGNRFERLMIFFNKALNYLASDDAQAARIEISQAELLVREWKGAEEKYPFLSLFIGLIYEKVGDNENALVAYRRAVSAYKDAAEAPSILKQSYLQLLQRYGRGSELDSASNKLNAKPADNNKQATLISIVPRGFMTPMDEFTIWHLHPDIREDFLIALPIYDDYEGVKAAPTLSLKTSSEDDIKLNFENIVNVEREMRAALKQQMPTITTLALARAVVKSNLQKQTQENSAAEALVFIFNRATEVADTRSWDTLPQAFYFSRTELDPGTYSIRANRGQIELSISEGINFLILPDNR